MNIRHYAKFWVASIGLGLMALDMFWGIRFGFDAAEVYSFLISAAVAVGVLGVANT